MFVVFEGIDGSGKTTISGRVAQKLREAGLVVEHLREGGKFSSAVTQGIREFGRDVRNLDLTPHAELFLYVTRDVQLLDEKTRPALGRADVVIADRFLYSAEVLARFGRGLGEEMVRPVVEAAAAGLAPDLVVLVDVDPHVARARRQVAKAVAADVRPPSRKGLAGAGIQHRFRAGYQELAARDPGRWAVVDNDQDLEVSIERAFRLVEDSVRHGTAEALRRFRGQSTAPWPVPKATAALSSPTKALEAFLRWIDDRAAREPQVAAYFLSGLWGPGVDERRRMLAGRVPETVVLGLSGLDDPGSWELRQDLRDKAPARVARSLAGFPGGHGRARKLRALLSPVVPLDVLAGLDGFDDAEAWDLRDRCYGQAPDIVVASLVRLDTGRAWDLRERYLADKGGTAALERYDTAVAVCRSITGLDNERAWDLREQARHAAPIAALWSLAGMGADASWTWRDKWLERAPKIVLGTVRRLDDPRAWQMRERVADRCKEAIDSIQDLDGPSAWALRTRCADVWPSTVVKSLGPLAGTPQGIELVERQLRKYPENVSLLKHAAAIALGANVRTVVVVD